MHDFDVVIIGGGLVGRVIAIDLAQRHAAAKIAIIDAGQSPLVPSLSCQSFDNRVYAISPINQQYLSNLAIWQNIPSERISPLKRVEVNGDLAGRILFSAFEQGSNDLGNIVESEQLLFATQKALAQLANCQIFSSCQFVTYHSSASTAKVLIKSTKASQYPQQYPASKYPASASATIAEQHFCLSANLLIAADGRDSHVRSAAGLAAFDYPYQNYAGQALVANFLCQRPHYGTAYQWFTSAGILAFLPLANNMLSIVWSLQAAQTQEFAQEGAQNFARRVAAAGNFALGELQLVSAVASYPLKLIKVGQVIASRLALVGDAAHAIHPLSGHGLNLGLQDCQVLAEQFAAANWSSSFALVQYQRSRRENVALMQGFTDLLHQLFAHQDFSLVKTLRNSGMMQLDNLPLFKKQLINYALNC